jgi:hypothetical protein
MTKKKSKAKKDPDHDKGSSKVHIAEVMRMVHIPVDSTLLPDLTNQLLGLLKTIDRLTLQCKDTVAGFRASIKEEKEKALELRIKIEKGEQIMMDCKEVKDFKSGKVKYFRLDTNELVETRDIEEQDNQLGLGEAPTDGTPDAGEMVEDLEGSDSMEAE